MNTMAIKNLSIAVEALSRVVQAEYLFNKAESLLDFELTKLEEHNAQANKPQTDPAPYDPNEIPY